jgi:uncharacterized damage-inducible protein DinB
MKPSELLLDAFARVRGAVHAAVDGLTPEQLQRRPSADANSIAWLTWHLTRVQDDHVAVVAEKPQVWISGGWAERFGLPLDPSETGYGHSSAQVAAVRVGSSELLTAYHDAVYEQTRRFVEGLSETDLERIVDTSYDPPVSLGVRLVSVIADDLQHAGQAKYLRGLE